MMSLPETTIDCYKHCKKSAKDWCVLCKKAICNSCLEDSHATHDVRPIRTTLSQLQQNKQSVVITKKELEQNQKKITCLIGWLNGQVEETVVAAERYRDELIQLITDRTETIIAEVRDRHMSQVDQLVRDKQSEDNRINEVNKWIQTTTRQLQFMNSDSFDRIQTLIDESEDLIQQKPLAVDAPNCYKFESEKSLKVGQIVDVSALGSEFTDVETGSAGVKYGWEREGSKKYSLPTLSDGKHAARGAHELWKGNVRGGCVLDIKFISADIVCCVGWHSLHLYRYLKSPNTFRLLRDQMFDGHDLQGVASLGESRIYVTCSTLCGGCGSLHKYDTDKHVILPYTGYWRDKMFVAPWGVAVSASGIIAVSECGTNPRTVYLYWNDGTLLQTLGTDAPDPKPRKGILKFLRPALPADPVSKSIVFKSPDYLAWDKTERLVVSDWERHCVFIFESGQLTTTIGTLDKDGDADHQLCMPHAVSIDHENNILVADFGGKRLSKFDCLGNFLSHPLSQQLHPITDPHYVDVVKQDDTKLLLVGNEEGQIKIFPI